MKHSPICIPGRAPDSALKAVDKDGERSFKIGDYRGKFVVLVFYPGDWESRDIIQAFDTMLDRFKKEKCEVFACSTDSSKAHFSWIRTPSEDGGFGGGLRIPLISDVAGQMSQQYDVFDPEEGVCRNAVVIIDDSGVVRHAMATSMGSEDTARSCLELVMLLRQNKLSDSEIRNINSAAAARTKGQTNRRGVSPVRIDPSTLEKAWDVSQDPQLNKVLNIARLLGRTAPPTPLHVEVEPKFDISNDCLSRMVNPRAPVRACRASLARNLAGYNLSGLTKTQRTQLEGQVKRILGVAFMPEDLTGKYTAVSSLNQREQMKLFDETIFYNTGDIRLRTPGTVKWTEGSGVFINNYQNFLLWVNVVDQLKLVTVEEGRDLRSVLLRLKRAVTAIEDALKATTKKGFSTSRQSFLHNEQERGVLGTGFDLSFIVEFPGFSKEGEHTLKSVGIKEGLTVVKYGRTENVYDVRVGQQADDDIWRIVRRGIAGLDALWSEESALQTKHNIKPRAIK